jgi:hypothetical protein
MGASFCPNCGAAAQPGARFCASCGAALGAAPAATHPVTPTTPAPSKSFTEQYGPSEPPPPPPPEPEPNRLRPLLVIGGLILAGVAVALIASQLGATSPDAATSPTAIPTT